MLSGGRIMPPQAAIPHPQVQVQRRAVSLHHPGADFAHRYGAVATLFQPVPPQRESVKFPRAVKQPVFAHPQLFVVIHLDAQIISGGASRRDLQDEVRRLALFGNDVAIAGFVRGRVNVKGYQQVRVAAFTGDESRTRHDVAFAGDQGGFGVAQVLRQVVHLAGFMQVLYGGHIVGVAPWDVGKTEGSGRGILQVDGACGGHAEPRRAELAGHRAGADHTLDSIIPLRRRV